MITPARLRTAARHLWRVDALMEECNYDSSDARQYGWEPVMAFDLDFLADRFMKLADAIEASAQGNTPA